MGQKIDAAGCLALASWLDLLKVRTICGTILALCWYSSCQMQWPVRDSDCRQSIPEFCQDNREQVLVSLVENLGSHSYQNVPQKQGDTGFVCEPMVFQLWSGKVKTCLD